MKQCVLCPQSWAPRSFAWPAPYALPHRCQNMRKLLKALLTHRVPAMVHGILGVQKMQSQEDKDIAVALLSCLLAFLRFNKCEKGVYVRVTTTVIKNSHASFLPHRHQKKRTPGGWYSAFIVRDWPSAAPLFGMFPQPQSRRQPRPTAHGNTLPLAWLNNLSTAQAWLPIKQSLGLSMLMS